MKKLVGKFEQNSEMPFFTNVKQSLHALLLEFDNKLLVGVRFAESTM